MEKFPTETGCIDFVVGVETGSRILVEQEEIKKNVVNSVRFRYRRNICTNKSIAEREGGLIFVGLPSFYLVDKVKT